MAFLFGAAAFYWQMPGLMDDPDFPWHLAAGNLIRELGALPETDPWSYTAGGAPWYNLSWLWDVFISFCVEHLGLGVTRSLVVVLGAGMMALLMRRMLATPGVSEEAAIVTGLIAALALGEYVSGRAVVPGMILMLLFQEILNRSREPGRWGGLLVLPPLACLWANLHGSVVVAGVLFGAYGLEALIARNRGWFLRLLAAGIASALAALLNPYGADIIPGILRTMDSVSQKFVVEWQPFGFSAISGLAIWVLLFLLVSDFASRTVPLAERMLAFAWLILTFQSARQGSLFVLISAPLVAANLGRFSRMRQGKEKRPLTPVISIPRPRLTALLLAAGFAFLILTPAASFLMPRPLSGERFRVDDTAAFVAKHYPGKRFITEYEAGSYLVLAAQGSVPVFTDGRAGTAYPESVLEDYYDFINFTPGWERIFEKYGAIGVILPRGTYFEVLMKDPEFAGDWEKAFEGRDTEVYLYKKAKASPPLK